MGSFRELKLQKGPKSLVNPMEMTYFIRIGGAKRGVNPSRYPKTLVEAGKDS